MQRPPLHQQQLQRRQMGGYARLQSLAEDNLYDDFAINNIEERRLYLFRRHLEENLKQKRYQLL